jgi:hypothetical protein
MARADSSLPQDWYASERARNRGEEPQHFSNADLDEMLIRLEPEQRTFLLSLPRFWPDLNQSLREGLGGWNYRGLYLHSSNYKPFREVVAARAMLTTIREERDLAGQAALTAAIEVAMRADDLAKKLRSQSSREGRGRKPSRSRPLVEAKAAERQAAGEQAAEKKAEAEWLAEWLVENHPNSRPLKANTIRNYYLSKYEKPPPSLGRARN